MGAAAEGRRSHFGVAAEGRHLYLSKTQTKIVFKWSQILPRPFLDHLNTIFIPSLGHTLWESPKPLFDIFLDIPQIWPLGGQDHLNSDYTRTTIQDQLETY